MYVYLSKKAKEVMHLFYKRQKSVKKDNHLSPYLYKILYICHDKIYSNE